MLIFQTPIIRNFGLNTPGSKRKRIGRLRCRRGLRPSIPNMLKHIRLRSNYFHLRIGASVFDKSAKKSRKQPYNWWVLRLYSLFSHRAAQKSVKLTIAVGVFTDYLALIINPKRAGVLHK